MRYDRKKYGRVPITEQELRRGIAATPGTGGAGAGLRKAVLSFTTASFIADGSLFKLSGFHGLGGPDYIVSIYETDSGRELAPNKVVHQADYIYLWFDTNSKNYTVVLIG